MLRSPGRAIRVPRAVRIEPLSDDRLPRLQGAHVVLRPLRLDVVELRRGRLRRQAEAHGDDKALAIETDGELVGLIPYGENEPGYRHAAAEKVGFRPVGITREYWRSPDGEWRDGLLMDLLARELGRP